MARLWEKSGSKPLGVARGGFRPFLVHFAIRDILKIPLQNGRLFLRHPVLMLGADGDHASGERDPSLNLETLPGRSAQRAAGCDSPSLRKKELGAENQMNLFVTL